MMSVETTIQFIMSHNAALIEGLISLILLAVLFLAYRAFKATPDQPSASAGVGNLGELEATLKKLLEKSAMIPSGGGGAASPELMAELEVLKNNLQEKQAEIENLKTLAESAGPAAGGSGMSDDERAKLEAQLKEFKGKLEEYEIISEDIADLSFYKEENAKLLKQLESAGGAAPAPAAAATAPVPVPTPAAPASAPVADVPSAPAPAVAAPTPAAESAAVSPAIDDDLMAEFASAIETQKSPEAPAAAAEVATGVDDDLMAEFAKAVEEQAAPAAPVASAAAPEPEAAPAVDELGTMDMDKMMAEADVIGDSNAAATGEPAPNALDASLDAEKLMEEASALATVKPEDKNLMNEFETFVKKGP